MKNQALLNNKKFKTLIYFLLHPISILLLANLFVYGIFVPLLGYYWDDLNFYWFHQNAGNLGLSQYYAKDGPFLGVLYQINFSLLGNQPWHWQVFIFFWRWVCSAGFFFLFKQLFQNHNKAALVGSLVFLLYPGFSQQFIALCYGHYFIALSALVFSLGLSLYMIDHKKNRPLLMTLALFLAAINLITTEYFFTLELIRPFLIWQTLSGSDNRMGKTIKKWGPFLLVFISGVIWRFVIFRYQTSAYGFSSVNALLSQPFQKIGGILFQIIQNIWWTTLAIWKNVFTFPSMAQFGKTVSFMYISITILLSILFVIAIFYKSTKDKEISRRYSLGIILTGLAACLLGGIPYWSTGLMLGGNFPTDRFALSFILGSGLGLSGILHLLPSKPAVRQLLFVVLFALAGGLQVRYGITYKRDWEALQRFMWQLTWRVPAIEPGTIVFSNELPLIYYSDLSLTAPLNLVYTQEDKPGATPYLYYYPAARKENPASLTLPADQPIQHDLSIGVFTGNTNRSITLYYEPPGCLRIIDPEIELDNWMLPLYIRQTAALSRYGQELITTSSEPNLDPFLFKGEKTAGWCYSFEKADLARQLGNWNEVTTIADQVITGDEKPTDPLERFVYIEGYAHTENWQKASELTKTTLSVTGAMKPPLCQLWKRINQETPSSSNKSKTIAQMNSLLFCSIN